jgi:REP element-mobilizing transposase RayT
MASKIRLSIPNTVHHIRARSINNRKLFSNDIERGYFLFLLEKLLIKTGFKCLCWTLIETHYHLVIRINHHRLSVLMQQLNSEFALFCNNQRKEHGVLFQNRFKSIVIHESFVDETIRYVHQNPIRSGICESISALNTYKWSSHYYVVNDLISPINSSEPILQRFSADPLIAHKLYCDSFGKQIDSQFLKLIRNSNRGIENKNQAGTLIIGDNEYVRKILNTCNEDSLRMAAFIRKGFSLADLAQFVIKRFEISLDDLKWRGRLNKRSTARKVFACLATKDLEFTGAEVARFLNVSGTAISHLSENGISVIKDMNIKLPSIPI